MRTCFATRFGPEPFAAMLSEMRYLDHARRELAYLSALISSPTAHPLSEPESFSCFDDKLRFSGTIPSTQYCKGIFVDWMRAHRPFFDRVMASLSGKILKGDHSFKVCGSYQCVYALLLMMLVLCTLAYSASCTSCRCSDSECTVLSSERV
jgi:hypothetical protein